MNTIARITRLQSLTAEVRTRMLGNLYQFENLKEENAPDLSLEIVAGYLQQASEDACAVAEAMCGRFTTVQEMAFLAELSERSFAEFQRAFQVWKEQCLH